MTSFAGVLYDDSGRSVSVPLTLLAPAGPVAARFNRICYRWAAAFPLASEAMLYPVMAMQSSDAAVARQLATVDATQWRLVYLTSLRTVTNGGVTGVPVQQAPPDGSWWLRDQNGQPIVDGNGLHLVDPASSTFQQVFIAQAQRLAGSGTFNGVFVDELNGLLTWALPPGISCPKYATASVWQAAVLGWIQAVAPALRAAGLKVIGNIGGATVAAGLWQSWNGPLDGALEEAWTDGGGGIAALAYAWLTKLGMVAWSEANGKVAMLHSHNRTQAGNLFGLASMLLVANGQASYCVDESPSYSGVETWYADYDAAKSLGGAVGAYQRLPSGIYQRQFASGLVQVNPTGAQIAALAPYSAAITPSASFRHRRR